MARVLLHRLIDEVVDAAFELARHLFERFPEYIPALKRASALLVGIRAHLVFWFSGRGLYLEKRRFDAILGEVSDSHDGLRLPVVPVGGARLRDVTCPPAIVVLVALRDRR